jgi:hypothetical protein
LTSKYPALVTVVSSLVIAGISTYAFRVEYDYNLLHLQATGLESVEVQKRIFDQADNSLLFAVSLADNPQQVLELKQKFEDELIAFEVQKRAFDRAFVVYSGAVAEREATKQLNLARVFLDDKDAVVANRRLLAIIKEFPKTQAAKDAKTLLDGGAAAARKIPAEPAAPVAPVAPRLILPREPALVLPSYPEPEVVTEPKKPIQPSKKNQPKAAMQMPVNDAEVVAGGAAAGAATAGFGAGFVVMITIFAAVGVLVWMLPIAIAIYRSHPDIAAITIINVFFGPCATIGWWIALIWAVKSMPTSSTVNVNLN